ncbi:hypothetical protein RHSIM_Rhsim11G0020900 [Rhododendron simsii]|uniref:Uncharacterized protein n=1 Tax=Rhododendron simsii TaxID=118357 RepID=A0A834LBB6_RHOSS|nr:hypothetical protein RHSIM_Rhsim11G0020900 [Rhododendron simsii]
MSTKSGKRGGRGMTGHGVSPHGVTTRSMLTPTVQFTPNNGVTTRSVITPAMQSLPNNDPEQNSSAALHISESEQPNESLTPGKSWKEVPQDAKEMCIAHIRPIPPKKKFEKGAVDCAAHKEGANWGYLSNLWQDKDFQEKCDKYKDSQSEPRNHHVVGSKAFYKVKNHLDQAMANGSVPLTDKELSCTVFGSKPGYISGLGHGPKPSLTKFGRTSQAQLIRASEEAREETTAMQKKCEEALVEAA